MVGGGGRDTLIGGAGADRHVFADGDVAETRTLADRVTDFRSGEVDILDLLAIDAVADTIEDDDFSWIGGDAFSGVAGELRFAVFRGNTYVEGDTDGDALADFTIRLDGVVPLVATDVVG